MPQVQSLPSRSRRKAQRHARSSDISKKKEQKRRSKGKGKASSRKAIPPGPPMVWPDYPSGPVTVEEMQEIDRQQKAYIEYHGSSPWSPENWWGPDEESSLESDMCEEGEQKDGEEKDAVDGHHCPNSLEDDDIVRAIEFALNTVMQRRDDQQPPPPASQLMTGPPSGVYPNAAGRGLQPSEIATPVTLGVPVNSVNVRPIPVTRDDAQECWDGAKSRLRSRSKLRKTEKAEKIYRM